MTATTHATHTPGPWEANEHGEIWRHYRDEMGNRVSHPIGEAVAVPGLEHQQLPNAKVMAAAPMLLDALKAVEVWVVLGMARDPNYTHPQALENARNDHAALRAAIAAAEGR